MGAHAEVDEDLIRQLQMLLDAGLRDLVPAGPFALLDYPDHANVGDAAIWLGEIAYLREWHGRSPAFVSSFRSHDDAALRKAVPEGPILLHGGGNFGDIWDHHQDFRERIIARFTDRPIVQLPQSIHYRSTDRIEQTKRLIGRHPDFTLLVRDRPSFDFARREFDCAVRLCPDSALALGRIAVGLPRFDVLALLRTDDERVGLEIPGAGSDVHVEDWLDESVTTIRLVKAKAGLVQLGRLRRDRARRAIFDAAARARVARGVAQLARARAIVTDRLHAHILSLLIGRPHAVLDNSYGKIARFMAAFSGGTPLAHRAETMDEAVRWALQTARAAA